ncbi:MAG: TspO protein [Planctomycetes bacterium GWF2_41_51]|nr:MAG: TspO protein [Planctomycetes bacterium GWF2_41_51]HBG25694.1 TspO protein [Phycisphaerales bacterium]
MKSSEIKTLVIICILILALGYSGSFFVRGANEWYETLKKPVFTAPGWVFGPVWTVLYLLMGIAFFLILRKGIGSAAGKTATACFIMQFIFNLLWTPVFFGLKQPLIAFGVIVILWLAVLATTWSFYRVSKIAGTLLIPYLLWVSFAAILNASICILNQ